MAKETSILLGCRLESVDASAAPDQWLFRFEQGITLNVVSLWRVISAGRVLITSVDHGQMFGLSEPVDASVVCQSAIGEAVPQSAAYDDITGDLTIKFSKTIRLEAIVNSSGYESWTLSDARGNMFVGLGGGSVAVWRSSPAS